MDVGLGVGKANVSYILLRTAQQMFQRGHFHGTRKRYAKIRWRSNWWSQNLIDQRTPASKIITMANWLISVTEVSQILIWLFCNTLSGVCPLEIVHISNFHADLTSCYIRRHHIVKIQLEESQTTQQWGRVHDSISLYGFYKHWVECALRNPKYLGRLIILFDWHSCEARSFSRVIVDRQCPEFEQDSEFDNTFKL